MTIGVLDIFGFEIFQKNMLEQLFINFANEKLQGLYIDYIFKNECRIFEEEGLSQYTNLIVYKDNKPLLVTLDNAKMPPGVFDLADQACLLSKTDEQFYSELQRVHRENQLLGFAQFSGNLDFVVRHTARDTQYDARGFVEKNKDEVSQFLFQALETSQPHIVQILRQQMRLKSSTLFEETKTDVKEKYLGHKFRKNMNDLIAALQKCHCHFVRCIKPNEQKKSDCWDAPLVLR